MYQRDLQDLETAARLIISVAERNRISDENAADMQNLLHFVPKSTDKEKPAEITTGEEGDILQFTQKEIEQMPKTLQKIFKLNGLPVRLRKRETGKNKFTYEYRFRRFGYDIESCGKTKEEAKQNFLKKAKNAQPKKSSANSNNVPNTFSAFAQYYFNNFRKPKVTEETYQKDSYRLKKYLLPYFKEKQIKKITPTDCKILLEQSNIEKKTKTQEELYSLMSLIFKAAIAHGFIERNPIELVLPVEHERKHGKSLTRPEKIAFFLAIKGTIYELAYALIYFTGARPNEVASMQIDGEFIKMINSKRHGRKIEYKRVPILDGLRPYLPQNGILPVLPSQRALSVFFNRYCPNHKLYDLRTTFNTLCQECGVTDVARKVFMGHSLGTLQNAYTDLSDDFLLKEAKKLNCDIDR